jgi:hypothetical protein
MDISQIASQHFSTLIAYILGPVSLIFIVAAMLSYFRSRSSHPILLRIWTLTFGKAEINSTIIKCFSQNESDLAHFTYLTKIRVATVKDAEQLIKWALEKNLSLKLIKSSGEYFDVIMLAGTQALYALGRKDLVYRLLAVIFLAIPVILGLSLSIYDRAIIQMRDSRNFLTINPEYVSTVFAAERFYLSECPVEKTPTSFDAKDLENICNVSFDNETKSQLSKLVKTQRAAGALLATYTGFFFLRAYLALVKVRAALELRKRLSSIVPNIGQPAR